MELAETRLPQLIMALVETALLRDWAQIKEKLWEKWEVVRNICSANGEMGESDEAEEVAHYVGFGVSSWSEKAPQLSSRRRMRTLSSGVLSGATALFWPPYTSFSVTSQKRTGRTTSTRRCWLLTQRWTLARE